MHFLYSVVRYFWTQVRRFTRYLLALFLHFLVMPLIMYIRLIISYLIYAQLLKKRRIRYKILSERLSSICAPCCAWLLASIIYGVITMRFRPKLVQRWKHPKFELPLLRSLCKQSWRLSQGLPILARWPCSLYLWGFCPIFVRRFFRLGSTIFSCQCFIWLLYQTVGGYFP